MPFYSRLILRQMKVPGFLFLLYLFYNTKLVNSILVYLKITASGITTKALQKAVAQLLKN